MKTTKLLRSIFLLPLLLIIMSGCNPYSTQIKGDNNNMNGSFETVKKNLPVNWYFYSPGKVPNSDFDIISDDKEFKEGDKSLKFIVRKCESLGGWHSPGFFQDFNAVRNETYKISFWAINKSCEFQIVLESSVEGTMGTHETVLQTKDSFTEWKYYEFHFKTAPTLDMIRFEANILTPGTIWFDDIKIEGESDKDERTLR
jgi:hypothetical protein